MIPVLAIIILVLDFIISIWNAYASGFNIGLLKNRKSNRLSVYSSYSGLALAFAGIAYVLIVVLSIVAASLGYVDVGTVQFVLAFDFLVFGLMIIGFGLMVTVQSIIIATERKSIGSILVALWNVFAEVWDIASYVAGFKESVSMLSGKNREEETNALIIVAVAVLIAFFITHAAYRHGFNKAQNIA